MSIRDAIQQPRVHAQWVPDNVFAETRMRQETLQALKTKGHNVSTLYITIEEKREVNFCAFLYKNLIYKNIYN